jgi:putative addiction module component (TIGR02574 family)
LIRVKAISEVAKDALELPPVQRLTLARILLDLSDENLDFSPEVESAWETEICRRMEEVKAGRARSAGFDEVFARLDRRFPARRLKSFTKRRRN